MVENTANVMGHTDFPLDQVSTSNSHEIHDEALLITAHFSVPSIPVMLGLLIE